MNAAAALGKLQRLRVPAVTTADAAAVLGLTIGAASHALRRLSAAGLLTPVRRGLWALGAHPDPLALAGYVTAPYPNYLSLQTALHHHGMIEQIPASTYLVSLARGALVRTSIGSYSVHHVQPAFFDGFELLPGGISMAHPEKALVDFFYLSPTRSRLFTALPELELPRTFKRGDAREWARRIPSSRLRKLVQRRLEDALKHLG
jgi:predicted transcriptional regulator of viral defense system